jgi:hypothetical protein
VLAGGIFVQQHIMAFLLRQLIYSRIFLIFFQSAINFVMKDAATDAFKGINPETGGKSAKDFRIIEILFYFSFKILKIG